MCARYVPGLPKIDDQHTLGHLDCPACEKARNVSLSRLSSEMLFSDAASVWLEARSYVAPGAARARFIRITTKNSYEAYIDSLGLFFAQLRLGEIHVGHIRQYQEARITGAAPFIRKRRPNRNEPVAPCPCGAKKVNQELSLLKMIMRRANCWTQELDEYYQPFREDPHEVQRALTPEEQQKWLEVALLQQSWWIVHWYSQLAFGTSMGPNEMRALRVGDLNLHHEIVCVPPDGAKSNYRARTIPLIRSETKWAAEQLLRRAYDLGSRESRHYLFPFCLGRSKGPRFDGDPISVYDPTRPMTVSGIKKPWDEVRAASGLTWFTRLDTRHTALTRWAESGMTMAELMSMAGHITVRMMRHYMHISDGVKRRALAGVAPKLGPQSQPAMPMYLPSKFA